jgi:phage terminase large subunit-like protein
MINIGNSAWPNNSKFTVEALKLKRNIAEQQGRLWEFYQEYYGVPRLTSNPKFDVSQIKQMGSSFQKYEELTYLVFNGRAIPINVFIGVDPGIGLKNDNDYTIITVIGVTPTMDRVLLHIERDRIEMKDQLKRIRALALEYMPINIRIETYGYQLELYRHTRDMFNNEGLGFSLSTYQENLSKSKKFLEGLSPVINGGKVFYLDSCKNAAEFLHEVGMYSGLPSNDRRKDDTLDGFFLANHGCYGPMMYDVFNAIRNRMLQKNNFSRNSGFQELNDWRTA